MKTTKENRIAVGYVRTATKGQTQDSISIASQERKIKEYCRKNNIELKRIFKDEGMSGVKLDRPALNQLLTFVKHDRVDMVVCSDIDRLSRNVQYYLTVKSILEKQKIEIVTLSGGIRLQDNNSLNEMLRVFNSLLPRVNRERKYGDCG